MKYLCIEASGPHLGFAAVFYDSKKEFEYQWSELHSEHITQSLKPLRSYLRQLNFIAVDIGPGRFTGIRTAVNFAKTLAYYLKIPVYPCHSLRIIAEPYLKDSVLCIMTAFGQMFYTAVYEKREGHAAAVLGPSVFSLAELEDKIKEPVTAVGDVFDNYDFSKSPIKKFLKAVHPCSFSSQAFSQVVCQEQHKEKMKSWQEIEPCYLRVPGVIRKSNE